MKKKKFLMGESMGGAVVLLLHRKKPEFWDGGILIAPMCKVNRFTYIIYVNSFLIIITNLMRDRLLRR